MGFRSSPIFSGQGHMTQHPLSWSAGIFPHCPVPLLEKTLLITSKKVLRLKSPWLDIGRVHECRELQST